MSALHPRSRWRFPNLRYTQPVSDTLHFIFREPIGFHQGARLKGADQIGPRKRAVIQREKRKALATLH